MSMPLEFQQFAERAIPTHEDRYGQTVSVNPVGSDPVEVTAVVADEEEVRDRRTGLVLQYTRKMGVSAAQLGTLVPEMNWTATIGGTTYSVDNLHDNGSSMWFDLSRHAVSEVSRDGYRRAR